MQKIQSMNLKAACKLVDLLTYTDHLEVLIVDDSNVIANKVKNCLETFLLTAHIAKNGLEALDVLNNNPDISIVITDYNMDEMDGLELIKRIRKGETHADIPILIMTSELSSELKIKFYKNGASDFLIKPIIDEELKAKVSNIFSNMNQLERINEFNKVVDENVITSTADAKGFITDVSKAFCEIAGYEKEELIGKPHNIVRHPEMPSSLFEELWTTIKSGKQWKGEVKNLRKDGTFYWVKVIIEPNFDRDNNITGFTSVRQDITDRKRIYELSITDGLTSLYNRRYFNDITQDILDKSSRTNDVFGFLILDIDNFKKYNDTYGHQMGDDVLIQVANSLKQSFKRSEDKIFRLGGEEFGVLISAKKEEHVLTLAEQARENIQALGIVHEKNLPSETVTASFGLVIVHSKDHLSLDEVYKIGDDKLYEAKNNGRNRIEHIIL